MSKVPVPLVRTPNSSQRAPPLNAPIPKSRLTVKSPLLTLTPLTVCVVPISVAPLPAASHKLNRKSYRPLLTFVSQPHRNVNKLTRQNWIVFHLKKKEKGSKMVALAIGTCDPNQATEGEIAWSLILLIGAVAAFIYGVMKFFDRTPKTNDSAKHESAAKSA
jgi:hypothetical protein